MRKIAELCAVRREIEAVEPPRLPSADEMVGIHPLALKLPHRWEAAIAAMIYAASGQVALRE
ncbi:hypothetical protein [Streptomyces sp. NPDC091383]|uniref:hypothetical protein n=1 Tax=Streptomyces sp. NPDC091383 TaxID=3365996 RepID=UPI003806D611